MRDRLRDRSFSLTWCLRLRVRETERPRNIALPTILHPRGYDYWRFSVLVPKPVLVKMSTSSLFTIFFGVYSSLFSVSLKFSALRKALIFKIWSQFSFPVSGSILDFLSCSSVNIHYLFSSVSFVLFSVC